MIKSERVAHCQEHEHADGDSHHQGIVGDVEGEVGDEDVEEGGDNGGDEGTLHPPDEVQPEAEVGVLGVVATLLIVEDLGDSHTVHNMFNDHYNCRVNTHKSFDAVNYVSTL